MTKLEEQILKTDRDTMALRMRCRFARRLPCGLHPSQMPVLTAMSDLGECTQRQLADRLGVAASTVAVSLKRLEAAGLVCRQADEQDLRSNLVSLTEDGKRASLEGQRFWCWLSEVQFKGFSEDELISLNGYMERIKENLEREIGENT